MNRICMELVFILILIAFSSLLSQAETDLDAVRKLMPGPLVKVESKSKVEPAAQGKPPFATDNWVFDCSGVQTEVHYNRFFNQKPEFDGVHQSLTPTDMGVGFGPGPFSNWYYNGAIRILIDGVDVMAAKRADIVEYRPGNRGDLRLVWNLEDGGRLALYFTLPSDGRAIYAAIEPYLPNKPQAKVQLKLMCYPGGFGPAYNVPSIRSASTRKSIALVPRGFTASEKNPFPILTVSSQDDWIFYADDYEGTGSLFLAFLPTDWVGGKVAVSNYGQETIFNMRPGAGLAKLAFYASGMQNGPAKEYYMQILPHELKTLSDLHFWVLSK